eukprot:Rmarinus@m.27166
MRWERRWAYALIQSIEPRLPHIGCFDFIPRTNVTATEFYLEYMIPNRPIVLTNHLGWNVFQSWLHDDGSINWTFIQEHFGSEIVPYATCDYDEDCPERGMSKIGILCTTTPVLRFIALPFTSKMIG